MSQEIKKGRQLRKNAAKYNKIKKPLKESYQLLFLSIFYNIKKIALIVQNQDPVSSSPHIFEDVSGPILSVIVSDY